MLFFKQIVGINMNVVEIVRRMERAGVTLHLSEGKLQVRADTPLTDPQRDFIRAHKDALIHYLNVMADSNIQYMTTFFNAKVQAIHSNEIAPV